MLKERGHDVTIYSLEPEYAGNKQKIAECDFVFVCVPTPTTPEGHDVTAVAECLKLVGRGRTAVIKSTVLPGSTEKLQAENPDIDVIFSPEFLTEATAEADVRKPDRHVIGVTDGSRGKAAEVLNLLPPAPFERIVPATLAELVKYGGNCWFVTKVLFMNTLYEMAGHYGVEYGGLTDCMAADPRIGRTHLAAVHDGGRGAGGDCFVKDFAAYARAFGTMVEEGLKLSELKGGQSLATEMLAAMERYNVALLDISGKSQEIMDGVYGADREKVTH